jgi:CBS domain-containing protein
MVMFSKLRRFRLRDEHGAEARLHDLAVDLSGSDYPPVTSVFFRDGRQERALRWDAVTGVDWHTQRIFVPDLSAASDVPPRTLQGDVLLDRDVMDALILDVPNRQSMRANDLWLEQDDRGLWLRAADIGAWAVLRRLGQGLLGHQTQPRLLDWRDVEFLRGDPRAAREGGDYHRRVAALQPAEIARLLDAVPYLHAAELLDLLDESLATDTLEVMRPERQVQVFEELEPARRIRLLQLMAPDNAADLLGRLGPEHARSSLEALEPEQRARVIDLLRYPEDTAGGIMTNDIVLVEANLSVAEARRRIRDELRNPDFVYYVFAVDEVESRHLLGVLTLRDLLVADEHDDVQHVMRRAVETLDPLVSADAAARRVADQHLAALPVVSNDGRVLGAVTADAALLQLAPTSASDELPRVFS